jgi:hypothetical protein
MIRWLTKSWWEYLLEPRTHRAKCSSDVGWFGTALCRMKGHPAGPRWYNPGGLEPDMRCWHCGDDLG